jgi:RNA polymerase sigma-70 factor (sigma-E family)
MPDRDGFAAFIGLHTRELQRTAWLLCGDWQSAQDLVQSTFVAVWPRWETVSKADSPIAYVRRVLVNVHLRGRRRRWSGEIATGDVPQLAAAEADCDVDMKVALAAALSALPARQRVVLVLRYFADLAEPDVARLVGCSVSTVKKDAAKALSTLRTAPALTGLLHNEVL